MPEALPLQPGDPRRLGAYEITGRLGVGEQGAVFLGRDPSARVVAVKLLHVRLSGEPVARSRFSGAFTSARKVSGFYTAAILDADVEGDRPYVVSEWVDGPSLQQLVDEEGPRGGAVVERLAVGTAVALAAVHRAGALHHDLKPGNVLLSRTGPRMSDFGIARALEAVSAAPAGQVTEDPSYKAPEQLSGRGIGPAADVFAWAATILFAVMAKAPFGDDSPSEVMQRIVYDDPDLSDVPASLREVMADALAKDPAERPTVKDLLERLLADGTPLAGRMPSSMVDEGRALASGAVPSPQSRALEAPAPAAPSASSTTQSSTSPGYPSPGSTFPENISPGSMSPRYRSPGGTMPGGGEVLGQEEQRVTPPPKTDPPVIELDPAAFEATAAFKAVGSAEERTASFRAIPEGHDSTATFDSIDLHEPTDRTEPTPHIIPGPGAEHGGGRPSTTALSFVRSRRPSNHVLGVALSLIIGVSVGIAIISLVLWPQMKDDDTGPPADHTGASDNRPVTTIPPSFAGAWKGTVVNTNRNVSFPVEVTFETGGTTARVIYPRENCTGKLTLSKGTESSLNMALEIAKPCTNGTVRVTRQPDGTLQYVWRKPRTQLGYAGRLSRG